MGGDIHGIVKGIYIYKINKNIMKKEKRNKERKFYLLNPDIPPMKVSEIKVTFKKRKPEWCWLHFLPGSGTWSHIQDCFRGSRATGEKREMKGL